MGMPSWTNGKVVDCVSAAKDYGQVRKMRNGKNRPQCPWSRKPSAVDLDSLRMIRYGIDRSCTSAGSSSGHSQMTKISHWYSRTCFAAGSMTGSQGWHPGPLKHDQRPRAHSINELRTCVLGGVLGIVDKYFPKCEHARSLGKIWPKVFPNVLDRVNTQPVYAVVVNQFVDPIQQLANDCRILRVKIGQRQLSISEPALFYSCLVPRVRGLDNVQQSNVCTNTSSCCFVSIRSVSVPARQIGWVPVQFRKCPFCQIACKCNG